MRIFKFYLIISQMWFEPFSTVNISSYIIFLKEYFKCIFKLKIFLLFEFPNITKDCLHWYYYFFENLKLYYECFITWKKETSQSINIFLQSFTILYVHKVQKSYKHILEMLCLKCFQQTSFLFISLFSDPDSYFYINSCL